MRWLRAFFLLLFLSEFVFSQQQNLTRYVDPFIGTSGHGHTFPGATMPFGMVQLSPDTRLTGWDGCSGYHYSDQIVYGFSHTHLSGTGISDYGDILFMPTAGKIYLNALNGNRTEEGYASLFDHKNEEAQPGYYSVRLDDENIVVELTTTRRVGFHRYHFPRNAQANIILDLEHRDRVLDSALSIVSKTRIEGYRRSKAWAKNQIVYFVAEFSRPMIDSGISLDASPATKLSDARATSLKAFFRFGNSDGAPIQVKVAISSVSIEGARKNLNAEINHWDFERVRADATRAWNAELNKIQVRGGDTAQLTNFYTALYHAMIAPNLFMDVDGQYLGRDFKIHQARNFDYHTVFSLWDTFRATHPLYTIIDQKRTVDFIRTFLKQYEQGQALPVWELAANETDTMIGYHAVSVIADAAVKGIRGFNRRHAFEAMKSSADTAHSGMTRYGTFGVAALLRANEIALDNRGFLSVEAERESVSKTLEYAYDDWCIAEMAKLLGLDEDYQQFIRRAQYYKNVFDAESGFMRPRTNGDWLTPFDPREVDFNFTEANSWQYSFFVPQDISGLIELIGGKDRFAHKLDQLFSAESKTTGREQADITGLIGQYAHGNEPSHHMAYLYNYVNQPWKTQGRVRQIMDTFYRPEPDGLIGNEDCGQMSAWYVFSAAGFYPVTPGSPIYVIGTPLFPELRFNLENGKSFIIKAPKVSQKNIYIHSARLNGRPYSKSYLKHQDLMAGGELVFEMGDQPNPKWGSAESDVPVSRIVGHEIVPVPVIKAAGKTFKNRLEVVIETWGRGEGETRGKGDAETLGRGDAGRRRRGDAGTRRGGDTGKGGRGDGETRGRMPVTVNLYYTLDGKDPGPHSLRFTKPFFIDRNTTVKAVAIAGDGRRSHVAIARYHKIPHDWTITLFSKYSSQYTGGGDSALIDGLRGNYNWSSGGWQGYQGQNFVAVVDLGDIIEISKLGAGFLQDVGSWILMPRQVQFELSQDGRNFTSVATIPNEISDKDEWIVIKSFEKTIAPQKARYIRIRAENYGKLPAWHAGSGGDAWIFIDEITIQ